MIGGTKMTFKGGVHVNMIMVLFMLAWEVITCKFH